MIDLIQYIFVVASLSYLVTTHKSFQSIREFTSKMRQRADKGVIKGLWGTLESLIHCEYCMGFWLGLLFYYPIFKNINFFNVICYALMAAITSAIIVKRASKLN
jgi:hypothetical protein